jgi:O-antigen ligase
MFALDFHPWSRPALAASAGMVAGTALVIAITRSSPVAGVLALAGMAVAIAVFMFPMLGVLLCAAVIPMERIGRLTPDSSAYTVSLMRIVGLLALGSLLAHVAAGKWKLVLGPSFFMYAIYCGIGIVTVFFTTDKIGGVRAISAVLGNLLFFFLILNAVRNWKTVERLMLVWLGASVLIGLFTVYEWHSGNQLDEHSVGVTTSRFSTVLEDTSEWENLNEGVKRALGPTSSPAVYAINMILTLPFFVYLFRTRRRAWHRAGIVTGLLIVLYNVMLTNTRAAIILAAVVMMACVVRMVPLTLGRLLLLFALVAAGFAAAPGAIYERILNVHNYTYEGSGTLRARFAYWNAGLQLSREHWLAGVGLGNQLEMPKRAAIEGPEASSLHNEYLNTFMEVGIAGWLVFFGFVGLILWYGFRAASIFRTVPGAHRQYWFTVAMQIAMIGVLLYAVQVDVFHFPLKGWWLLAGFAPVMHGLAQRMRQQALVANREAI